MDEYISREALNEEIEEEIQANDAFLDEDVWINEGLKIALKDIKRLPAAAVQPVKRGRWDFQGYQLFKCTNCKEMITQDQLEAMQNHKDCEECTFPNFCPNCGADMRGDTD